MGQAVERTRSGRPDLVPGEPAPLRPDQADRAGGRGHGWLDLLLVAALALVGLAAGGLPTALRIPLGLLAVLLAPGYALIAAVFPTSEQVDRVERLALSLGTSLGLIIVQAFVLDRVPGGLAPTTIQAVVGATTLALVVVAAGRRASAPPPPRPGAGEDGAAADRPTRRAVRFTQALVVANLIVAGLAYGLNIGATPPRPTEFYLLGGEGRLADYPREAALGETLRLTVGVRQQHDQPDRYEVVARQGRSVVGSLGSIALQPGDAWQGELPVTTSAPGPDQEITIELRREGETEPLRTLRLWLDVRAERR